MHRINSKVIGGTTATPMRIPDKFEVKDNKMSTWHDDKVSPETYPSSLAMIEGVQKIHSNMLDVELADGGKIDKAIKESGGGGSTQADYNQNDSTQPDYIKNRPFYTELISVEADLSKDESGTWFEVPVDADAASKLLDFTEGLKSITIEVLHNGEVYRKEGLIDKEGYFFEDDFSEGLGIDYDGDSLFFANLDGSTLYGEAFAEFIDGVSVKIYREEAKKLDKKFLPPNDVPYIYSEDGRVRLHDLDTGVYVLHGRFELGGQNEGCWFGDPVIAHAPTLCQLINDKDEENIRLSWVNVTVDEGLVGRYVEFWGTEISTDEYMALWDLVAGVDQAVGMAEEAIGAANDANEFCAEVMDVANEAYWMAEEAFLKLEENASEIPFFEGITVQDEAYEKFYKITVDSNGNVKAIPID